MAEDPRLVEGHAEVLSSLQNAGRVANVRQQRTVDLMPALPMHTVHGDKQSLMDAKLQLITLLGLLEGIAHVVLHNLAEHDRNLPKARGLLHIVRR